MFNGQHDSRLFDARVYSDLERENEFHKTPQKRWGVYQSDIQEYQQRFSEMLPFDAPNLLRVVDTLQEGAVIVDICADTTALRSINRNIFGVAISLTDHRTMAEKDEDGKKILRLLQVGHKQAESEISFMKKLGKYLMN